METKKPIQKPVNFRYAIYEDFIKIKKDLNIIETFNEYVRAAFYEKFNKDKSKIVRGVLNE